MADRLDSPFELWAQAEGVPIIRGHFVTNAYEVPLKPWMRNGGLAAFVILEGGEGFGSACICEIPPGRSLNPEKHLFEERIYILQGQGETRFWSRVGAPQTVAWQEHALFSPPLNIWHQHTNTGDQPAKYLAVTNAPLIFNIYRNPDFIFSTDFDFEDRYRGGPDYFGGAGKMVDSLTWAGGFVPDVRKPFLLSTAEYGSGYEVLQLALSGNTTRAHLAQVEVGTYKKPHRHHAGAHLIIVEGTGYALMWQDWDKRIKADFQKGTIYCPPEGWWHTHCNTGTQVVKQVALKSAIRGTGKIYRSTLGVTKGGDMLDRDEEDPAVRRLFEEELARKGLKPA
ncbi:MAG: cupin domain-containing protein [Chloroflexi bacterium]|nr:cupin domain-containing protein [Chloroflexota bacterium]